MGLCSYVRESRYHFPKLELRLTNEHTVVSLLSLIPLVNVRCSSSVLGKFLNKIIYQLHDIVTHELALRIGGARTGLLNASLVCPLLSITIFHNLTSLSRVTCGYLCLCLASK